MAYPSPPPQLDKVVLTLRLPTATNDHLWSLEALGQSHMKRASIWSRRHSWTMSEVDHGLQVADHVHWFLTAVLQDRPTSPFWLNRSELGLPSGVQLELPL